MAKPTQSSLKQLAAQEGLDPAFKDMLITLALLGGLPAELPSLKPFFEIFIKKESPLQTSIRMRMETQKLISKYRLDEETTWRILKPLELNASFGVRALGYLIETIQKQLQTEMKARTRLQHAVKSIRYPAIAPMLRKEILVDCRKALTTLRRACSDMERAAKINTPWIQRTARSNAGQKVVTNVHEVGYRLYGYVETIHPKINHPSPLRVSAKPRYSPHRITVEILFAYVPDLAKIGFDKFSNSLKASISKRMRQHR